MSKAATNDYDVVVVGGGGAGMTAAIHAADAGARVALIEAGDRLGGSTALAGGLFYAAGTPAQRALGIEDTADAMYADILRINGATADHSVVRRLCDEGPEVMEWLESIGISFPPERLSSPSGSGVPRSHEPVGFGAKIAERLDAEVSRRPIDVVRRSRVERLLLDERGDVRGVQVSGAEITAGAVVLATGGYGGNPDWVARMLPKSHAVGNWVWHVGNSTNLGDGLTMAEAAGVKITGFDSGLLLITPNFFRDFEVIGPDWALLVNTRAERFMREDGAYWEIAEGIEAQAEPRAFYIFDRAMFETAKPHPRVLEALALGAIKVSWMTKVFEEQLAAGRIAEAPSIRELATRIGLDGAVLERTVRRYSQCVEQGRDEDFGKASRSLRAVSRAPYYAIEVRPAILTVTGGGLPIDAQARVGAAQGDFVPGLFAAGETCGNVYGRYYVGSGYAIASCITLGRIAGRSAAAWSRRAA